MSYLLPAHLEAPAVKMLRRVLVTRLGILTASSMGKEHRAPGDVQAESDQRHLQPYEYLGHGQCGVVYALGGTARVLKLPVKSEKIG